MSDRLTVEQAARSVAAAQKALEHAIREAHRGGQSLREIANAAGISHEQVRRVLSR